MRWIVLETLIKSHDLKVGAELGVYMGQTFLHLLETCPNLFLYGVDRWTNYGRKGRADKITGEVDFTERPMEQHKENVFIKSMSYAGRCQLYVMDTTEASRFFKDESLDFVFIDADHVYEAVKRDILNWSPKVRSGGFIIGHDIDWKSVEKAVSDTLINYTTYSDNVWVHKK